MSRSGQDVPDQPPAPIGTFCSIVWWWDQLAPHVVQSAYGSDALEAKQMGPRGGWWYAATISWSGWAQVYRKRSARLKEGKEALEVARRLSGDVGYRRRRAWFRGRTP